VGKEKKKESGKEEREEGRKGRREQEKLKKGKITF
jgi:hypothetical protein